MLSDISGRLSDAIEGKKLKEKLARDLRAVRTELQDRNSRLITLRAQLEKEKVDVEKLEQTSLKGLFYSVLGSREEQLEKERQEMLAAQLRYQQTEHQVEFLQRDKEYLQGKLEELAGVDAEYESLMSEKERILRQTDEEVAGKLLEITEQSAGLEVEIKELTEAITAGVRVITGLEQVAGSLESAGGWGTWDMLGGGFVSTAVKHSRIDEARKGIHSVQTQMSRFTRELADVRKHVDVQIDISELASFADFFFDGLIVDWVVQSRIHDSLNQTVRARKLVHGTVDDLKSMKRTALQQKESLEEERTRIIERG